MLLPLDYLFRKYRISTSGLVHLGANIGQEAEDYAVQKIPRVIWIEALPEPFDELSRKIVCYPGHTAICACVGDRDGEEVWFNVANNSLSSSFLEFGTHAYEYPEVAFTSKIKLITCRLDTLVRKHGIEITDDWFLNIDLQGAELHALHGVGNLLQRFRYVYVEVNEQELYEGCALIPEIDSYLLGYGFVGQELQMTEHGWGEKFYMRLP